MCRIFASYVAVGSAGAAAEEGGTPGRRRHKIVTKILLRLYLLSPWHSSTPRHGSIPPGEVYSNDTLELRGTGGLFIYIRYISRMRWRDVVSM